MGNKSLRCCPAATPIVEAWGHASGNWTSPANLTSVDLVVKTGTATVTVGGVAQTYSAITSPRWGVSLSSANLPAGYIVVAGVTGDVQIVYQTK